MKSLRLAVVIIVAIILVGLGLTIVVRVSAKSGIAIDPADAGYCAAYGIEIDGSSVEKIYQQPEAILADPEAFLSSDDATLVFSKMHYEWNDPLDVKKWSRQVERIANLPTDKRGQELPNKFTREIMTGQETWCKIAVPHVLSYLPAGTEFNTKVYLLAFDPLVSGQGVWGRIVMNLSHPLYWVGEKIFHQGSSSVLNILAHELFHVGYNNVQFLQTDILPANGAEQDLLVALQNEGMAVRTAYTLREYYPCPMETNYRLLKCKLCVRYMMGRVNKVLDNVASKSEAELYQDIHQLYSNSAIYMVGGYMAGMIEEQLGKEALVGTLEIGPRDFLQAYNSIAEKGMEIHFHAPNEYPDSLYLNVLTAAAAQEYDEVRENLEAIKVSNQAIDVEVEGYLLYKAGYTMLGRGEFDLAEQTFQLLIESFPDVASLYIGLGDVYVKKGDISQAIPQYERAVELEPRQQWLKVVIEELAAD